MNASDGDERQRRGVPWQLIQPAAFLLACVFFVLRLDDLVGGEWGPVRVSAWHQFWPVLWLLVLSVSVRTRSSLQVLNAAFMGFFTSVWIASVVGDLVTDVMGKTNPDRLAVAVPVVEELAKVLPLVLVAWTWRRQSGSPGIIDFGLAGIASGAGFALHEDALWGRVSSSGTHGALGWLLPSMHTEAGLVAGHAVWTGIVGLAFGVVVTRSWRRSWWLIVGALAVVMFDHGSWNNPVLRDDWRWLLGNGWLPAGLLIGGLLLGFVADVRALRRVPQWLRWVPSDLVRYVRRGTMRGPVRRWWGATRLMRLVAAAAHGRAADPAQPWPAEPVPGHAPAPVGT